MYLISLHFLKSSIFAYEGLLNEVNAYNCFIVGVKIVAFEGIKWKYVLDVIKLISLFVNFILVERKMISEGKPLGVKGVFCTSMKMSRLIIKKE